jgi:hypothetical protein
MSQSFNLSTIKFRCHHKAGFPSSRQARVFIVGHGSHIFDWPHGQERVECELHGGVTLIASGTIDAGFECSFTRDGKQTGHSTKLHYRGETEAPNSKQTYSGD